MISVRMFVWPLAFLVLSLTACAEVRTTTFPKSLGTSPWAGVSEKTTAWAEQLLGETVTFKAMADNGLIQGDYQPYVDVMAKAREAYRTGDRKTTYESVNQFMTMLEARVGNIDDYAADTLWDTCYRWTPDEFHARDRHARAFGPEKLERWEQFINWQQEKASLAF